MMLSTHPCHQTHCIRRFDTHSSGEGLLTGHFLHYKSLMEWGGTSVTKFRSWGSHSGWYGVPTNPPLTIHGPPPWYHGSDNNGYCTEHHSLIKSIIPTTTYTNTLHHINMLGSEVHQILPANESASSWCWLVWQGIRCCCPNSDHQIQSRLVA